MFIWTISGLTLAACADIEDFLGLDDGGGARGPVRFTPPADDAARMAHEAALAPPENDANWQLPIEATSTRMLEDGTPSPIASYEFVIDNDGNTDTEHQGFTISQTADGATISFTDPSNFDFEALAERSFTLTVQASDTPINADDEARTGRQTYTITVQNVHEGGEATYEIMQSTPALAAGTVLTAQIATDSDLDGVARIISYQWFRDDTEITGATGATYTISGTPAGVYSVEVSYLDGYNAGLPTADQEPTMVEASTSPITFMQNGSPTASYTGTINEDGTTATLPTIDASVADAPQTSTYAYEFVTDADTDATDATHLGFTISSAGAITFTGTAGTDLDYETTPAVRDSITLTVRVTYDADGAGTTGEVHTRDVQVVIDVNNVDETGMRAYEIDAPATLEVGSVLTAQRVAGSDEDPDGVDENSIEYVWLADDVVIPGATSATYTIDGDDDLSAIYTVQVSYLDGYHAALAANDPDRMRTEIEVSTSPIKLAGAPYTGSVNEDGTSATLPQIMASVDGASANQITYDFLVDGSTSVADQGFSISQTTGQISTFNPSFDYETTPRITLTVRVFYDADGNAGTTNDIETRDVQVVIDVGDVNEAPVVEGVQVTANDPLAMAGIPTLPGTTSGDDTITLSTTLGRVETIYYRFTSTDGSAWVASDGTDTISNFRRGEDRLIFIDEDGTVIDLETFIDHNNLAIRALRDGDNLTGVEILFGTTKILEIQYHSSSYEQVFINNRGEWIHATTNRYLGDIAVANLGDGDPAGYNRTTRDVATTSLLPNYFGANGNTNLQIVGDDILARLGADVFISERRNFEDGAFATVTTSDPDADTSPNGQIARYTITGGTGELLFVIDETSGEISVKDQVTLDYDAATSYTLLITARDGGSPAMEGDHTITIGLIEDFVSEYSISKTGNTYSADLDTPDSDGVDMASIEYQWFTTPDGGTNKNDITGIAVTNQKTLDTTGYTLPDGQTYGVTITYTDNADNEETSEAYAHSVAFAFETRTGDVSVGFTGNFPAVNADFTAVATGGGTVTYSTSGTDGDSFEIREGSGRHNLYFKTTPSLTAGETLELTVIATEDAGGTTDSVAVTITVTASSPAIIPDRQAFAHQDPYEPDDLGLTPMPDADPSAG